jgi:hypothetical protein
MGHISTPVENFEDACAREADMVVAVAELNGRAFRWNLTANVGPGQPNKLDDVELVRFGYICMRQNLKFPPSSDLQG